VYLIAVGVFFLAPLVTKVKLEKLAQRCKGKVFAAQGEASTVIQNLLANFHAVKRESFIVLYLDGEHRCLDVAVSFGNKRAVHLPADTICERAVRFKAKEIVVARNHVEEKSSPSNKDIFHAAALHSALGQDVVLSGYFVWCQQRVRSVINSQQFRNILKGHGVRSAAS
jgi:DNA repair protein RadC